MAGYYLKTKNIVAKLDYVNHNYEGNGWRASKHEGDKFDGIVIEAVVGL